MTVKVLIAATELGVCTGLVSYDDPVCSVMKPRVGQDSGTAPGAHVEIQESNPQFKDRMLRFFSWTTLSTSPYSSRG